MPCAWNGQHTMPTKLSTSNQQIGFGGGCHWCTEAVFSALRGVTQVQQGFIRSTPPHDSYSEAVIVHFDPSCIGLVTLIEIHLRTHASMSQHRMREKYRSAVYSFDKEQYAASQNILTRLQQQFDRPLVTETFSFDGFRPSSERFQNYYQTDPSRPFCTTHIDPKLKLLRDRFSEQLKNN